MLFLIRGLPGSGKTTLAWHLSAAVFAADDYFETAEGYVFDPSKLAEAHQDCQRRVLHALERNRTVAVANTFTQRWEMEPYLKMAEDCKCRVTVLDLFDGGRPLSMLFERGLHGVPLATLARMATDYEHDWRNGNPLPPWERKGRG